MNEVNCTACLAGSVVAREGMAEKIEVITRTSEYAPLFEPTGYDVNTRILCIATLIYGGNTSKIDFI